MDRVHEIQEDEKMTEAEAFQVAVTESRQRGGKGIAFPMAAVKRALRIPVEWWVNTPLRHDTANATTRIIHHNCRVARAFTRLEREYDVYMLLRVCFHGEGRDELSARVELCNLWAQPSLPTSDALPITPDDIHRVNIHRRDAAVRMYRWARHYALQLFYRAHRDWRPLHKGDEGPSVHVVVPALRDWVVLEPPRYIPSSAIMPLSQQEVRLPVDSKTVEVTVNRTPEQSWYNPRPERESCLRVEIGGPDIHKPRHRVLQRSLPRRHEFAGAGKKRHFDPGWLVDEQGEDSDDDDERGPVDTGTREEQWPSVRYHIPPHAAARYHDQARGQPPDDTDAEIDPETVQNVQVHVSSADRTAFGTEVAEALARLEHTQALLGGVGRPTRLIYGVALGTHRLDQHFLLGRG